MAAKADTDREFQCKYCGETIIVKSTFNKPDIMCGSCGQFIVLKLDKNEKNDIKDENDNKKLSKQYKSEHYKDGRIAIVPKATTNKLGGNIVKLPTLTGINNVEREIKDKKGNKKKKKADK